jgi:hypothetical protein
MNLGNLIFGERPPRHAPLHIKAPPPNVAWRKVRPRGDQELVRAWLAEADSKVRTPQGPFNARAGKDYIVQGEDGERRVVRGDIFKRTYEPAGDGGFRKRRDLVLRYFTLDRPALIETLEGPRRAAPGDWIMQGVAGELWPAPRAEALQKYEPA